MDKKSIAGAIVCLALLIAWYPLMNQLGWMPQPATPQTEQDAPLHEQEYSVQETSQPPAKPLSVPPVMVPQTEAIPGFVDVSHLDDIELINAKLLSVLNLSAGGIAYVDMMSFNSTDRKTPVRLGDDPTFPFLTIQSRMAGERLGTPKVVEESPGRLAIARRTDQQRKLEFTESWTLDPDNPYKIHYDITVKNLGPTPVNLSQFGILCGSMAPEPGSKTSRMAGAGTTDLAIDIAEESEDRPRSLDVSKIGKLKFDDLEDMANRPNKWIAVHNKYFVFSVASEKTLFSGYGVEKISKDATPDRVRAMAFLPADVIETGQSNTYSFTAYTGPKEFKRLKALGGNLERIMRLDLFFFFRPAWMGALSSTLLRSLIWLNSKFDHRWGYGLAIIVLTIIIKTLFWPLTHKSTISMRRMQKLQPLMQELKEKYQDQPQKLQQKTMELYREHKVNPLGGCLPIVFQIPVFFGLFNTLRGAIELRQASFLWVTDLALPDTLSFQPLGLPIRPLAILMGLSMILQQHMTPASPDPNQKRMMTFMSLFFIVIFYGMPAGLTLYWTVNQGLTIIQSIISRRLEKDGVEPDTKRGVTT